MNSVNYLTANKHDARFGSAYGRWFHRLVRSLPAGQQRHGWSECFAEHISFCPIGQRERASTEWRVFLESTLAALIAAKGFSLWRESRFSNPVSGFAVPDLCAFEASTATLFLVEIKTDYVETVEQAERLITRHRHQLQKYFAFMHAYRARRRILALYSSAIGGRLIVCRSCKTASRSTSLEQIQRQSACSAN